MDGQGCASALQGDVLEISAGTGRNMPYYNFDRVNNITFTDLSPGMLKQVGHAQARAGMAPLSQHAHHRHHPLHSAPYSSPV